MKVYKCLIQIYYAPQSYISATGEPRGFIIEYWNIIKKKLKEKGITFKEEITYSRNYGELINQVIKKNYKLPFTVCSVLDANSNYDESKNINLAIKNFEGNQRRFAHYRHPPPPKLTRR